MSDILELVENSNKNLFVGLAGPGTGKSFAFKRIVKSTQFDGKKILILSFIRKLIKDLEETFDEYGNVEVSTLHSFAMQVYSSRIKKIVKLDEGLDSIITQDHLYLNGETVNYQEKFYEAQLSTDEEAFYRKRAAVYTNGDVLHSFNSVIYGINKLFESNPDHIPKYDLILVDEFQDFNELEWKFISLLNSKNKVILVGDDDQSLYDWKNAKPQLIRDLYANVVNEKFSFDYCYRCTEVIVDAVNDLIANSKADGFLSGRVDGKKYIYPNERTDDKNDISAKYNKIDFLNALSGYQLMYQLVSRIKKDTANDNSKSVLVLAPSYYKQKMYEGLVRGGLNVVDFELFGDEKHNMVKHRYVIESFRTLEVRKTDNLALRKVLYLYIEEEAIIELLKKSVDTSKKLWNCMEDGLRAVIEADIALFKKVRQGKYPLDEIELARMNIVFNLKNLLSKMINGFDSHTKSGIEVELTTVMSSKGLAADFVYFVGVDDYILFDPDTHTLTDQKVCEFLVGITRAKEKLTMTSFREANPKLVSYINNHVNRISTTPRRAS